MLRRISADKHTLRQTVTSLETANQELKQAQAEIVRAEKMASVGRLAAGIAHEIGNPIGIVLGYMDLIRQPDLDKSEHDDFARRAEKEIQRINTIIRQLLDLARPKESVARLLSVHAVIEEIVSVLTHQPMMTNIRLQTAFNAADDHVWADADQLRQVFLNLLLNAADAICDKDDLPEPRIDIRTTHGQGPATSQADWIAIDFQDNGEGIAEDQIENIFDPFYTTKEPGKGTGLGLSVSYMIIEKLGGTIAVQSHRGQGTTFTIRLPLRFRPTSVEDGESMHLQIADQPASSP
jgi:signal transduction histidine kinase